MISFDNIVKLRDSEEIKYEFEEEEKYEDKFNLNPCKFKINV